MQQSYALSWCDNITNMLRFRLKSDGVVTSLTGCTARMEIRRGPASDGHALLLGINGVIDDTHLVTFTATAGAALPAWDGSVFEALVTFPNETVKLCLAGNLYVRKGVVDT